MSSNNIFTQTIEQRDVNGIELYSRFIQTSYAGNVGVGSVGRLTTTAQVTLSLPVTPVLQFFLLNSHTQANIALAGTPQGGALATLAVIPAGGSFSYFSPVSNTTAGFTDLRLTASTTGVEYVSFIGG